MQALTITTNGTVTVVNLNENGRDTLAGLQRAVGGSVDVVRLGALPGVLPADLKLDMWVDDEGMYTSAVNPIATLIAATRIRGLAQDFHGTAVYTASNEDGDTVGLPQPVIEFLLEVAGVVEKAVTAG